MSFRKLEYYRMYDMYLKYEDEYLRWSTLRKQFNEDVKKRKYYRKNGSKTRRKYAEMVIADYSELVLSGWDVYHQVGGCKEIVFEYGLTDWIYDTCVIPSERYGGYVYMLFRDDPDLIYRAIEETYDLSIELGIKTTDLANTVPSVIEFIATRCLKQRENVL